MCELFANHIFQDYMSNGPGAKRVPCGRESASGEAQSLGGTTSSSSSTRKVTIDSNSDVQGDKKREWSFISVSDIPFRNEVVSRAEIDDATAALDKKGADLPIGEGPERELAPFMSDDEADLNTSAADAGGDATTDEETEIPGLVRPKLGEGWWGRGPPLRPQRKGLIKTFADGAGLPSPGRWPIAQRRLPDDDIAHAIRRVFKEGLIEAIKKTHGGDFKKMLMELASGTITDNPFSVEVIDKVRTDLRLVLKQHGVGDGLPRAGDLEQDIEVRLIQDLSLIHI